MLALAIPPIAVAFLCFYFLRSSKEMPKNWRALLVELKIQASGAIGLGEDTVLRFRNKVGKFMTILNIKPIFLNFDNFRAHKTTKQNSGNNGWQQRNWPSHCREAIKM